MLHKENCFIAEIEGIFDRKILEEANNISFYFFSNIHE